MTPDTRVSTVKVIKVSMGSRDIADLNDFLDLTDQSQLSVHLHDFFFFVSAEEERDRGFYQGPQKIWLNSRDSLVVLFQ